MSQLPPSPPRSRRPRRWIWLFLISLVLPPLIVSAAGVIPGAITVIQTGTCPPSPPDIPAYPCSLWEYLWRMIFGVWAFVAHFFIWLTWAVINFVLWGVGLFSVALYRSLRSE